MAGKIDLQELFLILTLCQSILRGKYVQLETNAISKLERSEGRAEVAFVKREDSTQVAHLYQSGCLRVLIPKNYKSFPDAVIINTAGGITGGDNLEIKADIGEKSEVCLTTQTAERIYKSGYGFGKIGVELNLRKNSKLDWLPQETILFDNSAVKRSIKVNMSGQSKLFMVESIVLGRRAMGETLTNCLFSDQWKIFRDNMIVDMEALKLVEPSQLSGSASLGSNTALATILYVAKDAEERLQQMRSLLNNFNLFSAASAWNGKLIARIASESPYSLRKVLIYVISKFRGTDLPRVWLM